MRPPKEVRLVRDYSSFLIDCNKLYKDWQDTYGALYVNCEGMKKQLKEKEILVVKLQNELDNAKAEIVRLRHKLDDAMEGR